MASWPRLDEGWDNVMAGHLGEFASKNEVSKNELVGCSRPQ